MANESYRTSQFVIEIDGIESPGITKVTGLSEGETAAIDQPDAGTGLVRKISSGVVKFDSLTLERNMDGSPADQAFLEWFQKMFKLDGSGKGSFQSRRNGSIIVKNFGESVIRFAFYGAWVKSSKFSDLEAGSENLLKQTIVLEHDGLERVQ